MAAATEMYSGLIWWIWSDNDSKPGAIWFVHSRLARLGSSQCAPCEGHGGGSWVGYGMIWMETGQQTHWLYNGSGGWRAREPGMICFPSKWGAEEARNPQNHKVDDDGDKNHQNNSTLLFFEPWMRWERIVPSPLSMLSQAHVAVPLQISVPWAHQKKGLLSQIFMSYVKFSRRGTRWYRVPPFNKNHKGVLLAKEHDFDGFSTCFVGN